jgi:NAD(P)-dependent dehydrogenase (short-subunit alcohol dehydrogenase family)
MTSLGARDTSARFLGHVVVITGASSGIGRVTSRLLAAEGADLVIAARDTGSLQETAVELRAQGAIALPVMTDVSNEAQVEALAQAAVDRFGRIDAWVNDAGVYALGRAEDVPSSVIRKVIATNLNGTFYGSRAAIRQFRLQGAGTLVNVASGFGKVAAPLLSYYSASKFGVVGFSQALGMELRDERDIHVCCVLPSTIDTPIFQHAANFTRRRVQALPPVYPVRQAAEAIANCLVRPKAEVYVGGISRLAALYRWFAPSAYAATTARQVETTHFVDGTAEPTSGNVLSALPDLDLAEGGWSS